jgi:choline dehydrogenase-like flavoprotein
VPRDQFDVVVVGSGAGGAPIAYTLAKKGKSVLVLEKGPFFRTQVDDPRGLSDFKRDELFATGPEKKLTIADVVNTGTSFFNSHVEPDLNDEPHVYRNQDGKDCATIEGYTCQVVGGGTQLYGGVSLRFSPLDFGLATFNRDRNDLKHDPQGDIKREARDWPIKYEDLEPYYCLAEQLVGINGTRPNQIKPAKDDHYQAPLDPNPISHFIAQGMDALKMPRYRTPQAVITQDHPPSARKAGDPKTGFVNRYGCPLGLKSNTWVSLLRPISRLENFELRANCVVTHLAAEKGHVTEIHYRDPSGRPSTVKGKTVVIACSAIESVRLLLLSGAADPAFEKAINASGLLGKYFMTHSFGGASAVMPGRYDKSLTVDSDWATDYCGREEFLHENGLWAGATLYNNTSDQALPISLARTHGAQDLDTIWRAFVSDDSLTGQRLADFLNTQFGTRLSMTFMANQVPMKENRIELHPSVKDKWNRPVAYIIKRWHEHDDYLMDTLARVCRDVLAYGGDPAGGDYPVEGYGGVYTSDNALARIANHILGGARFGNEREDSVLDKNCRAWEFDNLYVTDGAFMPTSGSGNPTLTIQANAFRVADTL